MLSSAATQSQCRRRTPAYAAALRRSVCESSFWTSKDVYETSSSRLHAVSLTSVEAVYLRAPIVRVAVTDVPVISARSLARPRPPPVSFGAHVLGRKHRGKNFKE